MNKRHRTNTQQTNIYQAIFEKPHVNALILDGAVVVNMLNLTDCQTFQNYSNKSPAFKRLNVVKDVYDPDSLKSATSWRREKDIRRRVLPELGIGIHF